MKASISQHLACAEGNVPTASSATKGHEAVSLFPHLWRLAGLAGHHRLPAQGPGPEGNLPGCCLPRYSPVWSTLLPAGVAQLTSAFCLRCDSSTARSAFHFLPVLTSMATMQSLENLYSSAFSVSQLASAGEAAEKFKLQKKATELSF